MSAHRFADMLPRMDPRTLPDVLVVGAGPAGLAAAEVASAAGRSAVIADAMPSAGRKLLVAGRGGLNLTHSEPIKAFIGRYRGGGDRWPALLAGFGPAAVREWVEGLGIPTYVGTSGRIFPVGNQAATLLRRWIDRLRAGGVEFRFGHRFTGFDTAGGCVFETATGSVSLCGRAAVLALGGGSWPQTGSDGGWIGSLRAAGVVVRDLVPSNCGFDVDWPADFADRAEGCPLKNIALSFGGRSVRGELLITREGLEGGAIYQLSADLREAAPTRIAIDLKPDVSVDRLAERLHGFRGKGGLLRLARLAWNLDSVGAALLALEPPVPADENSLARHAKAVPVTVRGPRPLAEAISSAGGIAWAELDEALMLRRLPGVFAAGEMLDWDAPTGGYLLTGCLATGRRAGQGASAWVGRTA